MLEGLRQTEMVKKTSAALVQCVILVIERRRRTLAVSTLTLSIRRKRKCMKIALIHTIKFLIMITQTIAMLR